MAEKRRAKLAQDKKAKYVKKCPTCGEPMTATKVLAYKGKGDGTHKGMFWLCGACGYRVPTRRRK